MFVYFFSQKMILKHYLLLLHSAALILLCQKLFLLFKVIICETSWINLFASTRFWRHEIYQQYILGLAALARQMNFQRCRALLVDAVWDISHVLGLSVDNVWSKCCCILMSWILGMMTWKIIHRQRILPTSNQEYDDDVDDDD